MINKGSFFCHYVELKNNMFLFKKKLPLLILLISLFNISPSYSDERIKGVIDQMQIISQDLKTLEKHFTKVLILFKKTRLLIITI